MSTPRDRALSQREAQRAKLRDDRNVVEVEDDTDPAVVLHYEVESVCRKCYGHGVSKAEVRPDILSPGGRAHKAGRAGHTDCGIAVGDEWTYV